jgi:hypothetical protein
MAGKYSHVYVVLLADLFPSLIITVTIILQTLLDHSKAHFIILELLFNCLGYSNKLFPYGLRPPMLRPILLFTSSSADHLLCRLP